jgi:hypothetical protein
MLRKKRALGAQKIVIIGFTLALAVVLFLLINHITGLLK